MVPAEQDLDILIPIKDHRILMSFLGSQVSPLGTASCLYYQGSRPLKACWPGKMMMVLPGKILFHRAGSFPTSLAALHSSGPVMAGGCLRQQRAGDGSWLPYTAGGCWWLRLPHTAAGRWRQLAALHSSGLLTAADCGGEPSTESHRAPAASWLFPLSAGHSLSTIGRLNRTCNK
jgi:hypothetical protein